MIVRFPVALAAGISLFYLNCFYPLFAPYSNSVFNADFFSLPVSLLLSYQNLRLHSALLLHAGFLTLFLILLSQNDILHCLIYLAVRCCKIQHTFHLRIPFIRHFAIRDKRKYSSQNSGVHTATFSYTTEPPQGAIYLGKFSYSDGKSTLSNTPTYLGISN